MSTVIKAGETGRISTRLSTIDLANHVREAEVIVERARAQADRIIAEAREQARQDIVRAFEQARSEGFEKGKAEGTEWGRITALEEGRRTFADQHANLARMLETALAEIEAKRLQLQLGAETGVVEFALAVARKLTFAIGELNHEAARGNFVKALALVSDRSDLSVCCHPRDIESLREFAASMVDSAGRNRHVKLVPDEAVSPGGCVLRSGRIEVDASLETQISELVAALLGGGPRG